VFDAPPSATPGGSPRALLPPKVYPSRKRLSRSPSGRHAGSAAPSRQGSHPAARSSTLFLEVAPRVAVVAERLDDPLHEQVLPL